MPAFSSNRRFSHTLTGSLPTLNGDPEVDSP
jgi:hypothetical protein